MTPSENQRQAAEEPKDIKEAFISTIQSLLNEKV